MQLIGKALDEQNENILITLEMNKSGAVTREKDHTFGNHDLLCPAQLFNIFSIIQLSHFVVSFTHW